jgi:hypothetical protein
MAKSGKPDFARGEGVKHRAKLTNCYYNCYALVAAARAGMAAPPR